MAVVVREKALDMQAGPRKSRVIEVLHKVVGVADLYAWGFGGRVFDEIPPQDVKLYVTNDRLAEKDMVASCLPKFVGEREYACDDESDAVAVGVAWLLKEGLLDSPYDPPEPKPKKKRAAKKA